jgi:AcrR family transcriptional regulator
MVSGRRLGSEQSATRELIIKAAVEVLQDEGAAKLTAARIAEKAGVKAHMVHYYFRTMEDLVTALVRTHGQAGLKNTARAIASDEPLRALWELEIAYKWGVAAMEFSTIASHSPAAQDELRRYIEEIRSVQAEALARHFELRGVECPFPPLAITVIIASIARQLVREKAFGVTLGHAEAAAVVEGFLASVASVRGQA